MRALANIRLIQRKRIGLFTIRKEIPHDRDVEPLRNARLLLEEYLEDHPDGRHGAEARDWIGLLIEKEGRHELEVAEYYLKKNRPEAALSRTSGILEGQFPPDIKREAEALAARAREAKDLDNPASEEGGP